MAVQLPAVLFQYYEECYGEPPTEAVIRLIKHDLIRQIWLLLLDEDFMNAYKFGILILCADGIVRRVFPRILIYSADYPEKYVTGSRSFLCRFTDCFYADALLLASSVWACMPVPTATWIEVISGRWE